MNDRINREDSRRRGEMVPLSEMSSFIPRLAGSDEEKKKMFQAIRVKKAWERVAEPEVLSHTDNIFVFTKDGVRTMVCYVDLPIWAADLNANAFIYQMEMSRELGGDPIEVVKFVTSKASYKTQNFSKKVEEVPSYIENVPSIPLSDEERVALEEEASKISSSSLRKTLLEARIKDLEWKKGISAAKSRLRASDCL